MAKPRVLVLRAPGTNCDRETAFAFEQAGASCELAHVNALLESPARVTDFQILCLPGGFSYGDDIAAGRILAVQVRHHLADVLNRFHDDDKLILGICNGFQVLVQTGLLVPREPEGGSPVTLTANDSGRFEDRWVHLDVEPGKCVFLRGLERMYLPVAHAEGKFVCRDAEVLRQLEEAGQCVLRYAAESAEGRSADSSSQAAGGTATAVAAKPLAYPANPNGSVGNLAGLSDSTGRVLGLMPHPERHIDPTHHPQWTRRPLPPQGEGLAIFQNAVEYFGG